METQKYKLERLLVEGTGTSPDLWGGEIVFCANSDEQARAVTSNFGHYHKLRASEVRVSIYNGDMLPSLFMGQFMPGPTRRQRRPSAKQEARTARMLAALDQAKRDGLIP